MSLTNILFLNFIIHSLVFGAVGWLLVRYVLRDALRRCVVANLAVLFCLIGPFNIFMRDLFPVAHAVPVWTPLQETLEADWRVTVGPMSAAPVVVSPVAASPGGRGFPDTMLHGLRWGVYAGMALLGLRLLVRTVRVQRWAWRLRQPTAAEYARLPAGMDASRISVFDYPGTPCVAGWFFPVVAVPASAFLELDHTQWRWLMRHEGEHLRCNDTVAVLIQHLHRALLWWNPFVYALIEEYARAREEACDAAAVEDSQERAAYADFLLAWAAKPGAPQQNCVMAMAQSLPARRLQQRLTALMEARSVRKKMGALFVLACVAGVLVAPLLVASLGFATSVAAAQAMPEVDDGKLHTRVYQVPAGFEATPSARVFLEKKSIPFPEGASAFWNQETMQLIVRNTVPNLNKVEKLVEAAFILPVQVIMTTKLISADHFLATHGQILSHQEADDLWRSVAQTRGMDLMTAPELTSRLGQRAVLEVTQINPADEKQFVGVRVDLLADRLPNGKASLKARADLGAPPNATRAWPYERKEKIDWGKVRQHSVASGGELASGETLVLHLTTANNPVTVLLGLAALRPDGSKAASFAETTRAPAMSPRHQHIQLAVAWAEVATPLSQVLGHWAPGVATPRLNDKGLTVSGILTPEQHASLLRTLGQNKQPVSIMTLPAAVAPSGQEVIFKLSSQENAPRLKLQATVGADGHTLSVQTCLPDSVAEHEKMVTTSVSIWSGQTIILGGMPLGEPGHERILFITGTLQE